MDSNNAVKTVDTEVGEFQILKDGQGHFNLSQAIAGEKFTVKITSPVKSQADESLEFTVVQSAK